MKFRTLALLAAALTAGSCTKRPVQPQFTVVSADSLVSGNGFSCDFEYRFASISTPREAASAAIRQVTSDMPPPENAAERSARPAWKGEISAESEGSVVDTLLCYVITRSSYTGGAHGIYGTECYNYSLAGGYEITTADLFTEAQLERLNRLIREDICKQYGVRSDEELETKGFFPEYIGVTENFLVTPEGITFYYNPYDIGCYALGSVEVSVSREQLAGL